MLIGSEEPSQEKFLISPESERLAFGHGARDTDGRGGDPLAPHLPAGVCKVLTPQTLETASQFPARRGLGASLNVLLLWCLHQRKGRGLMRKVSSLTCHTAARQLKARAKVHVPCFPYPRVRCATSTVVCGPERQS